MKKIISFVFFLFIIKYMTSQTSIRYVALGDSYTIGTGTTTDKAWPIVLTNHLIENKINIELIANPSRNGWTSQNLIDWELPIFEKSKANFVTLLIGVNDWVQGVDEKTFQKNLIFILDFVQTKLADKSKIILVTIPDFGLTPTGSRYSNGRDISLGISNFNKVIIEQAKIRNIKVVDIYDVSKQMGKDSTLVADDGLHPSAKEYAKWETLIYPIAHELLK